MVFSFTLDIYSHISFRENMYMIIIRQDEGYYIMLHLGCRSRYVYKLSISFLLKNLSHSHIFSGR